MYQSGDIAPLDLVITQFSVRARNLIIYRKVHQTGCSALCLEVRYE